MKKKGYKPDKEYQDIECFKNTGMGIYISVFAFLLVSHRLANFWLAIVVGFVGVIACIIILSFDDEMEYILPAAEVAKLKNTTVRR